MIIDLSEEEKEEFIKLNNFYWKYLKRMNHETETEFIDILLDPKENGHLKLSLIDNRIENAKNIISMFQKMWDNLEKFKIKKLNDN